MSANEDPRTFCLRARADRKARRLRQQIAELAETLRRIEANPPSPQNKGRANDDPAWPLLARAIASDHPAGVRCREMLEDFAEQLDRAGFLSERQRYVIDQILYDIDGTPDVRALAFACPRCGSAVGVLCRGTQKPAIKIPHDERLALLPQHDKVRFMRRDGSLVRSCPRCGAKPGEPCEGEKGPRESAHSERIGPLPAA